MNEYNPQNPQQPHEQSQQPHPGHQEHHEQTGTPPPQPDPLALELKAFVEEARQKQKVLRELADREGVPAEMAEALRRLADRPATDNLAATVDHALSQSTGESFRTIVNRHMNASHEQPKQQASASSTSGLRFEELYRLDGNKMFFGVCSGLGDYFRVDPNIIRILFVIFTIPWNPVFFLFAILYVALAILLPIRDAQPQV